MFGLGLSEIIVIGIVGILLFGGRMPEMARTLGVFAKKIQRLFQEVKYDIEDEIRKGPPQIPPSK